ncbi:hypothetical protein [Oceanobacillus profundus]|uniref:Uncharacterized protein n=1 Tax=Oceanobacillus profundus TaxID=372463 RepID=A0A417YAH0_9BACI|nr:hypothetical protein [Oceanobacillus profundus]MBR3119020.1 hypothetical protein [Oceanobacillus sp.]MCM3397966.1 hypothetical protein [Oceanobacillus profundus]PAE27424.1 hypothetical protein CHI07_19595 [Paenibacillus sp. 7884-2]RHW29506.1 hypothetical protein D1B32_21785 [Oceanobacillus profundus]
MREISLINWLLEVDVNQTKELYRENVEVCECLYCENYMVMCKHLDSTIIDIFNLLGIQPSMPNNLSEFGKMEDGLHLYMGNYPIVGRLVEGEYCTDSSWDDTTTTTIKNFTFGFGKGSLLLKDSSTHPFIQLEFEARIPWGLHEEPED